MRGGGRARAARRRRSAARARARHVARGARAGGARVDARRRGGALRAAARAPRREPVAYVLGTREFWSCDLVVDRRVLIPRPETELLVETALRLAPDARRILDCATGSGAVAIAVARERREALVVASDVSPDALAVARANVARHAPDVALVRADLLSAWCDGAFDLVVTNPPYVAEPDLAGLMPEVRDFEPRLALAAGPDGLDVLRVLLETAARVLRPGGWLVSEIGMGQGDALRARTARRAAWEPPVVLRDGAGIERIAGIRRTTQEERAWTRS
ncbi:MAG: peptide chain release factor N(5)-glutamine methyltransferase [bacterium]|nr:peptide chain release factor N(5)-glutamine methyltransferase [bacterium]